MENNTSAPNPITAFAKWLFFTAIAITIYGFAIMLLWNLVVPTLFGLPSITAPIQGFGLFILCKILFGGGFKRDQPQPMEVTEDENVSKKVEES